MCIYIYIYISLLAVKLVHCGWRCCSYCYKLRDPDNRKGMRCVTTTLSDGVRIKTARTSLLKYRKLAEPMARVTAVLMSLESCHRGAHKVVYIGKPICGNSNGDINNMIQENNS